MPSLCESASPQYAMANLASMLCALRKFSAAEAHSKSCIAASPRRNGCCAAAAPELANGTTPKSLALGSCPRAATANPVASSNTALAVRQNDIENDFFMSVSTWGAPEFEVIANIQPAFAECNVPKSRTKVLK